jgi:hypothetical protein
LALLELELEVAAGRTAAAPEPQLPEPPAGAPWWPPAALGGGEGQVTLEMQIEGARARLRAAEREEQLELVRGRRLERELARQARTGREDARRARETVLEEALEAEEEACAARQAARRRELLAEKEKTAELQHAVPGTAAPRRAAL